MSDKEVAVGGGIYMPDTSMLAAIRRHIAEHHDDLRNHVVRHASQLSCRFHQMTVVGINPFKPQHPDASEMNGIGRS